MDFDKDNFEEDNELAPLEEEEAGDVEEVAGVEIDEIVAEDDTEDESEVPKRAQRAKTWLGRFIRFLCRIGQIRRRCFHREKRGR